MSGILVAIAAQIFIGASLVFDKVLLKNRPTAATLTYVFWIGILEGTAIFLAPFGFNFPPLPVILLALGVGVVYLAALFFYYLALKFGEASQSLAIVGGFAPIATLFFSNLIMNARLNIAQEVALGFLVVGGFILFFSEKVNFRKILPWVLLSSTCFGLANNLEKEVFNQTNFISGFVSLKVSVLLVTLALLLIPKWREHIVFHAKIAAAKHKLLYFGNRALAGIGSILVFYAISLAHPALVDGIGGLRFVVIFFLALCLTKFKPSWLKERFDARSVALKAVATFVVAAGLLGLGLQSYYQGQPLPPAQSVVWGVTFSPLMSKNLGLDWRANYAAIITDLKPRSLRLISYWNSVEPNPHQFDFVDLDWQMNLARDENISVILVIGQKTPRWPECHFPAWLDYTDTQVREVSLLEYETAVVNRYKNYPNFLYWQVENEPFLLFGECPSPDAGLLEREIALVKSLDRKHQILLTDGGEFGDWYRAAVRADVFGTTLYRKVYNRVFGEITYPLTPEFYPLKETVVKRLAGKPDEKFIVIELGLEPWTKKQIYEIPPEEQLLLFNINDFKDTVIYAREARFDVYYLWGAEWWYAMKTKYNHPEFWDFAKNLYKAD